MALRTFLKIMLAYVSALVADCVRDIECKIVTSFLGGNFQELAVLRLREMLLKIEMKGRATCKMLDILASMKAHLVYNVQRFVFNNVEIAVVAVTRHCITVFPIPFCMLHSHILRRNHLAIEQCCLGSIPDVVFFDKAESVLNELDIIRIVVNLNTKEFSSLYKTVYTNRKILSSYIDEAGIKEREHSLRLKSLKILIICKLYLVDEIYNFRQI